MGSLAILIGCILVANLAAVAIGIYALFGSGWQSNRTSGKES
jgi:hypothetical protein